MCRTRQGGLGGLKLCDATWLDDITSAYGNLGGVARYDDLYQEVARIRGGVLPASWREIVRRTVQDHSSDSEGFDGVDLFYSVEGVGAGVWGLRSALKSTPPAADLEEVDPPGRVLTQTYRVLRDTELVRKLKSLHRNVCQVCGQVITLGDGSSYSEGHHIQPLGGSHKGPDIPENILVLCPNHHVMLDYGSTFLDVSQLRSVQGHYLGSRYVKYHNEVIYGQHRAQ